MSTDPCIRTVKDAVIDNDFIMSLKGSVKEEGGQKEKKSSSSSSSFYAEGQGRYEENTPRKTFWSPELQIVQDQRILAIWTLANINKLYEHKFCLFDASFTIYFVNGYFTIPADYYEFDQIMRNNLAKSECSIRLAVVRWASVECCKHEA